MSTGSSSIRQSIKDSARLNDSDEALKLCSSKVSIQCDIRAYTRAKNMFAFEFGTAFGVKTARHDMILNIHLTIDWKMRSKDDFLHL